MQECRNQNYTHNQEIPYCNHACSFIQHRKFCLKIYYCSSSSTLTRFQTAMTFQNKALDVIPGLVLFPPLPIPSFFSFFFFFYEVHHITKSVPPIQLSLIILEVLPKQNYLFISIPVDTSCISISLPTARLHYHTSANPVH